MGRWIDDDGRNEYLVVVCDECGCCTTDPDNIRYFHQAGAEDYCDECYRKMQEEQCKFGGCRKYCVCDKKEKKEQCNDFEPCLTYMDKYNNDVELWKELHGE